MKCVVGWLLACGMTAGQGWAAVAAPAPVQPVGEWIQQLGDDRYQTREEATRKLWEIGEPALPSLREAEKSRDPEVVKRASELIGNIEVGARPDSERELLDLIAQFRTGNEMQKTNVLSKLRKKQAWGVMLKLYSLEQDGAVRGSLLRSMTGVASQAAREAILAGKEAEALKLLKLAPRDDDSLMALAVYHRVFGTLKKELAAASEFDPAWKVALLRAAGRIGEAQSVAKKGGLNELADGLAVIEGDPVPWMMQTRGARRNAEAQDAYLRLAVARWQGQAQDREAADMLARALRDTDRYNSMSACAAYFLLGDVATAEAAYRKFDATRAFQYFDAKERFEDALRMMGLEPEQPDYGTWFARQLQSEDVDVLSESAPKVLAMIVFLERRGMHKEIEEFADPCLLQVAKGHADEFLEWLTMLNQPGMATPALETVRRLARKHAGDDKEKWGTVVSTLYQEGRDQGAWWEWLQKHAEELTPAQRFDVMTELFHPDDTSGELREKILARAWKIVDQQKADEESKELQMLTNLAADTKDAEVGLRAWDAWKKRPVEKQRLLDIHGVLEVAGRWDEAADFALKMLEKNPGETDWIVKAAACLRRAGRDAQAQEKELLLEKMAIGAPLVNLRIAAHYAVHGDVVRACQWNERALYESKPGQYVWQLSLLQQVDNWTERGEWLRAASACEAICAMYSTRDAQELAPAARLQMRLQADLCRALAMAPQNRDGALKILRQCHQAHLSDGSLADEFFPALRQTGFAAEQEVMFEESWKEVQGLIRRFPACENNYNTAAWMASRAGHRLDEAEALLRLALKKSPHRPAYLDTMAELYYARGQRKQALEWSAQSLRFALQDPQLWRQNARFRGAGLTFKK